MDTSLTYDDINTGRNLNSNWNTLGLDSSGQAGPTLQKMADNDAIKKQRGAGLESLFGMIAPMALYSGDVEAASPTMKQAQTLASLFSDWWKGGTPTINTKIDSIPSILKSGKFKNQMELAGPDVNDAWRRRIEVERYLHGYPRPQYMEKQQVPKGPFTTDELFNYENALATIHNMKGRYGRIYHTNEQRLAVLNEALKEKREYENLPPRIIEILKNDVNKVKQNPVYGHIYNPKYSGRNEANMYGDVYAEMSDTVKDASKYVLGDSFYPFVRKSFSSSDMRQETSALERALFSRIKGDKNFLFKQSKIPYIEMAVPNYLSRLNNIKALHIGRQHFDDNLARVVSPKNYKNIEKDLRHKEEFDNSLKDPFMGFDPDDEFEEWMK